ncbi:hypothetical protein [Gracilimonas tropica]|uniref:hypothetical protein n=1 Tax=Gracilimonas tropica TaxID=454600 RepID=UPI00036CB96C|nr:hypothetical protein [Gracilimonas tropica]
MKEMIENNADKLFQKVKRQTSLCEILYDRKNELAKQDVDQHRDEIKSISKRLDQEFITLEKLQNEYLKETGIDMAIIDERIIEPVKMLNAAGLITSGSCQGADFTNYDDYRRYWNETKGHHAKAYIQIADYRELPEKFTDLVNIHTDLTLVYVMENEFDFRCEIKSVSMLKNKEFPNNVMEVITKWMES